MKTISRRVSTGDLVNGFADVVGSVGYGKERVGVTRYGKLAAVMISVEDLELLEQLEDARDLAEFRAAKASDDGSRISMDELAAELAE